LIRADLHLHSVHSDGKYDVPHLLELLRGRDVTLAALTDHDTIAGVGEALREGRRLGMEIIPAVELAAGFQRQGESELHEVHILAYGINCNDPGLLELLRLSQDARRQRNLGILARLRLLGLYVDEEQLGLNTGSIGRPHIARQLVESGQVQSFRRVFDEYIAEGKPAWRPRKLLLVSQVCDTIHTAGGVTVLAHPMKNLRLDELDRVVTMGVDGIEAIHPGHNARETEQLKEYAQAADMFTTGGSDFHGQGPYLRPEFDPFQLQTALRAVREKTTNEETNA
jgi:3',5'-nucleoside bisphosphate phosphatase